MPGDWDKAMCLSPKVTTTLLLHLEHTCLKSTFARFLKGKQKNLKST